MKVKINDAKDNKAQVLFEDASHEFVNALRRTITNEVPVLAIHDVEFRKQSSVLYDEILAHRIGLIPITTDYSTYDYEEVKEGEEHSARSQVKLTYAAKGPGIAYAESFQCADPSVKPVFGKMPLVKLAEAQELEFEATAIMGKGKDHSKWIPGIATYFEKADFKVNNAKPEKKVREKFPPQIFNGTEIDVSKINSPQLLDAVEGIDDSVIEVKRKDNAFIFDVESFGMISPKDMLVRGFSEMRSMLKSLKEEVDSKL